MAGFLRGSQLGSGMELRVNTIEKWSILIKDAQGRSQELFQTSKKLIEEIGASDIQTEFQKIRTGIHGSLFSGKFVDQDYLVVTSSILKDFKMYVGAMDYGKNLFVSWHLACEPGFLKAGVSSLTKDNPHALSFHLSLHKQDWLTSYVTAVHHAVLEAVGEIMKTLHQDPSKIDRRTRGFLNIT